ncbi:MAG TPA: MmgE/PrpD family protein [Pseudonocardiaceae bacterium]|nr:MmgE/PrpD family protein [Pseudonocardiaceae bacterium]
MTVSDRVVDYVFGYRIVREDPAVVAAARLLVLDCLGVAFAGAHDVESGTPRLASSAARPDGCSIIGATVTSAPPDAAFVNGYSAHVLEFDDSTLNPIGHPSATILPALLAVGEAHRRGGADLLAAYLVALEVHARLGQARPAHWSADDPWLPIGTIGLLATVAGAARLTGLGRSATGHAIGLATHLCGQLSVGNGSAAKPLGAGHAARCAVQAVQWAEAGFPGPADPIGRPGGFADVFLGADRVALSSSLDRLGGPTHLGETGVAIKRYPNCYGTHWSVDALRDLLADNGLRADDVREVELAYPDGAAFLDAPAPVTPEEARFSLQYGLAACLVHDYPQRSSFTAVAVADPLVRRALDRITARPHAQGTPEPDRWAHVVTVRTVDGARYRHSVRRPRGHPGNPLAEAEIIAKFEDNTAELAPDRRTAVIDAVADLTARPDLTGLLGPLAA